MRSARHVGPTGRRSSAAIIVALSVALAIVDLGCGSSDSVIVVAVTAEANVLPVSQIRIGMSNAAMHETKMFPQVLPASPIVFPATLAIVIPGSRSGELDLAIDGLDHSMGVIANGDISVSIKVGGRANVSVELRSGASACGNRAIDPGEECDDGNRVSGDGCDFRCHRAGGLDGGSDVLPDAPVETDSKGPPADSGGAAGGGAGAAGIAGTGGSGGAAGGVAGAGGSGGSSPTCAGAVYCDTFEADNVAALASGWNPVGGSPGDWVVAQAADVDNSTKVFSQAVSLSPDSRFAFAKGGLPSAPWSGATTVSADVKAIGFGSDTGGVRAVWVCVRHAHLTDYYCLALMPTASNQLIAQIQTTVAGSAANGDVAGVPAMTGTWCHVQMKVSSAGTISATVNNVAVPGLSSASPFPNGYAALGTQAAEAMFDNVVVTQP